MFKFTSLMLWLIAFCDLVIFFFDLILGRRTRSELRANQRTINILKEFGAPYPAIQLLDLANGQLQPQISIFNHSGIDVIGIDMVNQPQLRLHNFAYRLARWLFSQHLRRCKSTPKRLVCGDVSNLPFADCSFDAIYSHAAFEHFLDVKSVLKECSRVLNDGGILIAYIHLFTSISGGHNISRRLAAIEHLPTGLEPWDHLRQRKIPFSVPLNEWRISDYLNEFEKHFKVVKRECLGREGQGLFTQKIKGELAKYDEEELLCANYLIVAQKALCQKAKQDSGKSGRYSIYCPQFSLPEGN